MDLVPHIRKRLEELLRGKYSDINLLNSSGGMGVIFKAMDTDLNVPRVIKVFPPGLALTEAARKRFLDEAQLQAGLSHANIVPVVNLLRDPQDPDFLAFIMPFISGESLADRLERSPTKPLGLEQTVSIMRQVLLALDHAHRQKIIHRDIKPANILLEAGAEGRVLLTDFGIAKCLENPDLTRTGMTIGTLPYMSPEQIQGSARHGTTDFYSLGCVLYECLTGVRLFRGSEEEMWRAKLRKEVPVEAERLSHYPEPLRRLLDDLLAWPPEKRPANARAVLTRLEEAVSPPDTPRKAGTPWPSRRIMWVGTGGLAVVIFVIVVSLGTLEPKDVRTRADGSSAPGPLRSSSLPKPASATTQKDPSARDHQGGETSSPGPPAPNPTPPSSPVSQTPRPTTPLKEGRMTLRVGVQGGLAPRAKLAVNGDQFTASVPFATSLLVKEGDILTVRIRDRENQFVEDTKTITAHIDGQATITFEVRR